MRAMTWAGVCTPCVSVLDPLVAHKKIPLPGTKKIYDHLVSVSVVKMAKYDWAYRHFLK